MQVLFLHTKVRFSSKYEGHVNSKWPDLDICDISFDNDNKFKVAFETAWLKKKSSQSWYWQSYI